MINICYGYLTAVRVFVTTAKKIKRDVEDYNILYEYERLFGQIECLYKTRNGLFRRIIPTFMYVCMYIYHILAAGSFGARLE